MKDNVIVAIAVISLIIFLLFMLVFFLTVRVWIQGLLCGVPVSLGQIIGMRLRGNPPGLIIDTIFTLKGRGFATNAAKVETVYIANKGQFLTPNQLADLVEGQDDVGG